MLIEFALTMNCVAVILTKQLPLDLQATSHERDTPTVAMVHPQPKGQPLRLAPMLVGVPDPRRRNTFRYAMPFPVGSFQH